MAYLGRGKPKSELRVNFNRGFEKMFEELSLQISRNLVTSEYAKVVWYSDRIIYVFESSYIFCFLLYIILGVPQKNGALLWRKPTTWLHFLGHPVDNTNW